MMGESRFETFMDEFGRAHAGHAVSTASFFAAAEKAHGKPLGDLKEAWRTATLGQTWARTSGLAGPRAASGRSIRSNGSSTKP